MKIEDIEKACKLNKEQKEIVMTDEQIRNIKFKFIGHLNTQDFHITTYKANNVPFELYMSNSVPTDHYIRILPTAKTVKSFVLNGKLISRYKLMEYLHNAKI